MNSISDPWVTEHGTRIKAWFVMRTDIEMSPGKMAVQVGHGTDFIHMHGAANSYYKAWMDPNGGNRRKIVLRGDLDHIERLYAACRDAGMYCEMIEDAGLTEFGKPTITGLVICPHDDGEAPKLLKRTQAWKPKAEATTA